MKQTLVICSILALVAFGFLMPAKQTESATAVAEKYQGAWESEDPETGNKVMILVGNSYIMATVYKADPPQFIGTQGGSMTMDGDLSTVTFEFNTLDSSLIGKSLSWNLSVEGDKLIAKPTFEDRTETYTRVDQGNETDLVGVWRISGRERDGKMTEMKWGARKTLKMITGTRFQWAAFNPETQQFSGCGGGTYTLENGKYTEHIDFFSRDNSRVGMSLSFDASVSGKEWDHSGLSSKGNPIHEIWKNVD